MCKQTRTKCFVCVQIVDSSNNPIIKKHQDLFGGNQPPYYQGIAMLYHANGVHITSVPTTATTGGLYLAIPVGHPFEGIRRLTLLRQHRAL